MNLTQKFPELVVKARANLIPRNLDERFPALLAKACATIDACENLATLRSNPDIRELEDFLDTVQWFRPFSCIETHVERLGPGEVSIGEQMNLEVSDHWFAAAHSFFSIKDSIVTLRVQLGLREMASGQVPGEYAEAAFQDYVVAVPASELNGESLYIGMLQHFLNQMKDPTVSATFKRHLADVVNSSNGR